MQPGQRQESEGEVEEVEEEEEVWAAGRSSKQYQFCH